MPFDYHEGVYSFSVKSKQNQSGAFLSLPYNTTRRSKIISLQNTFTIKNVRMLDKDGIEKKRLRDKSVSVFEVCLSKSVDGFAVLHIHRNDGVLSGEWKTPLKDHGVQGFVFKKNFSYYLGIIKRLLAS